MARASSGTGVDAGLAAQLDAVEHAAGLLVSRAHPCFDERLGFDFSGAAMMPHHESRPIWVTSTGRIFLEAFSPLYEQARDFLVAICEPKSRPEFIHEYALDRHALFAAASMGLTGDLICDALQRFSKCRVSQGVQTFVRACTSGYGKVKLVLHRSRFYVESPYSALLRSLAADPVVRECRVLASAAGLASAAVDKDGFLVGVELAEGVDSVGLAGVVGTAPAQLKPGREGAGGVRATFASDRSRVSARVSGEVNELEEDSEDPSAPPASCRRLGAQPAWAVPSADSMTQLSDDDLLAFIDRMDPVLASLPARAPASTSPVPPRSKRPRDAAASAAALAPKRPAAASSTLSSSGPAALTNRIEAEHRGQVLRFEIRADKVDVVRARCARMHPPIPLMLEYDFREDRVGVPTLAIELTRPEGLRPYQSRSLAKMFGNGRARSGMIVLPCGAGKTLVGIAAAATIKKSTIVLCPNETSINQWEEAFKGFTTLGRVPHSVIRRLTRGAKEPLPPASEAVILLTTYSMIGMRANAKAAAETVARLREIESREWGLMVLDETHQVVAETFRQVLYLSAHCRLGLTATLVREDGKERELVEMIGPKLYEANWMDLTKGGFLANVQVTEVWCPMAPAFLRAYLDADNKDQRSALAVMNPIKAWAVSMLLERHKARADDKIIVFSDSRFALERYATALGELMIHGDTTMKEREVILAAFREDPSVKVLFLSKVGDVALDVPDANVIIQISSHYGSRMQEAQRMGRILRKKKSSKLASGNHAFFYTLLSTDTEEVAWSLRRRRYLVDQGYAYKVLTAFPGLGSKAALQASAKFLQSEAEQRSTLVEVLSSRLATIEGKEAKEAARLSGSTQRQAELEGPHQEWTPNASAKVRASMSELSGGSGLRYIEYGSDYARAAAQWHHQSLAAVSSQPSPKLRPA